MIVSILGSLTALLLAGSTWHLTISYRWLADTKRSQQILLGIVLGILVVILGVESYLLPPRNIPIDADAGPLIFAGYLGGPIGSLIAALFGTASVFLNSGPIPWLGVFINVAMIAVGLIVRFFLPPKDWPLIPTTAVGFMIAGFTLLFTVPVVVAGRQIESEEGFKIAAQSALVIICVGIVSILLTWQILNYASRSARAAGLSTQLSARLTSIARNLPGVIMEFDVTNGARPQLIFISPKCHDMFGHREAEYLATPDLFYEAIHPEDLDDFIEALHQSHAGRSAVVVRLRMTHVDGGTRWINVHGDLGHASGRINSIAMDVSDEVKVQQQIEREKGIAFRAQKNESIGLLTGGIAHDFNNILAVIMGNIELALDRDSPPEHTQELNSALKASQRAADLVKSLLMFASEAPLEPEILDLNKTVRDARSWMGRVLPESISVETSLLAGLWTINADRTSLESSILNLILNARDAMEGKGTLTIETLNARIDQHYTDSRNEEISPGRYVMLAISDTGTGIDPEHLPSVFDPFYSTKPKGQGTGLGLSMVQGFIRQSGGTVQVYSQVGMGTTFKLYFPVAVEGEKKAPRREVVNVDGTGDRYRILLVEDEQAVREVLLAALGKAGHAVTTAATGDDALAVFKDDPNFDLLVTDIVMPGHLQGTHLALALREIKSDLPVVFLSGYASEALAFGNGLREEDIRLMKPIRQSDLLDAIGKAVTQQKAR